MSALRMSEDSVSRPCLWGPKGSANARGVGGSIGWASVQVLIVFIQLKLVFCVSQDLGHRAPLMGGPMTVLYQFLKKW